MADDTEDTSADLTLDELPQPMEEGPVDPSTLDVDGDNPNEMDSELFDLLKDRIRERGWVGNAIIVDADGLIADGEHRWRAALELGLTEVPVKRYDLSDEERRLLRQELNKIEGEHDRLRDAQEYDALLSGGFSEPVEELTAARDEDLEDLLNEMQEKQVDPEDVDEMTGTGPAGTSDPTGNGEQHPGVAGPTREAPDDPKAPPVQQEGENDPYEEWDEAGTAEDTNEDLTSEFKAHVHFRNEEDLKAFEELVGQTIPRNTWAIWYPEAERLDASDTYAVAEASEETETDGGSGN